MGSTSQTQGHGDGCRRGPFSGHPTICNNTRVPNSSILSSLAFPARWLTPRVFLAPPPAGPGAVHDGNNGAWRRGGCAWLLALPLAQLARLF